MKVNSNYFCPFPFFLQASSVDSLIHLVSQIFHYLASTFSQLISSCSLRNRKINQISETTPNNLLKELQETDSVAKKLKLAKRVGNQATNLDLSSTEASEEELIKLLELCPALQKLDLTKCTITNKILRKLPASLETLDLSSCDLTDISLDDLPKNLQSLKLSHCKNLSTSILSQLPPRLTNLDLSSCDLKDVDFDHLPEDLRSLTLSSSKNIPAKAFAHLPENLESLDLSGQKNLQATLDQLPENLKSLDLSFSNLKDIFLTDLPARLQSLDLSSCDLEGLSLEHLPEHLQSLILSECSNIQLRNLPEHLLSLELRSCDLDGIFLGPLPEHLQSLNLSVCKHLTRSIFSYFPDSLKILHLSSCDLINISLDELPPELRFLSLSSSKLKDNALDKLPRHLESLDLSLCNLNGLCFDKLPPTLTSLDLSRCDLECTLMTRLLPVYHLLSDQIQLKIATHFLAGLIRFSGIKTPPQNYLAYSSPIRFIFHCYLEGLRNHRGPLLDLQEDDPIKAREKNLIRVRYEKALIELGLDQEQNEARIRALEEGSDPLREASQTCEKIKRGELVIVPAGSSNHSIELVFYQSFMVICNRGLGVDLDSSSTMKFVPIDPRKFNLEIYQNIEKYYILDWNEESSHTRFYYQDLPQKLAPSQKMYEKLAPAAAQLQKIHESRKLQKVDNCIGASLKLANRACLALQVFAMHPDDPAIARQVKRCSKYESYLVRQYVEEVCLFIKNNANKNFPPKVAKDLHQFLESSAKKRAKISKQYGLVE